ncbi:hypothetical protein [Prauserella cavernicola]|uniref:Anti-sigma factor n=1 Tax=Prauserella cavernicola TaxID=2800127 RepID=A0A934QQ60_9PSEU|nr:hypothetical protein [Prauserella cavernicola]MBK1784580.1 hypothetical protein [Prauserella cavernicola]
MTDESRGTGGAVGPPWSVDLLADLHAGVLSESEAAELWPRVNTDPEARAILDALDATSADLASIDAAPVEPMPAHFAARLDAALEQEQQSRGSGNVVSIDAARKRRNKRAGWGAGFLAAAAAVVAAVVIVSPNTPSESTDGMAQPAPSATAPGSDAPLALTDNNLGSAVGSVSNVRDFGPLENRRNLDACLEAAGIDPAKQPVGFRPATIDGQDAVIVLYTTGELAQFRLVALAPDCGPDNPGLLRDETIGR